MINNKVFCLVWRILGLLLGVAGLVLMFAFTQNPSQLLVYFTIQTNIFTTLQFFVLMIVTIVSLFSQSQPKINPVIQLGTTFFITITMVVYWSMLNGSGFGMGSGIEAKLLSAGNYLVHGVVPCWAILDWLLFMPHRQTRVYHAAIWLAYPILYYVFAIVRAQVGGVLYVMDGVQMRYPYFFMEPQLIGGYKMLPVMIVAFVAGFFALGCIYVFIDKHLPRAKNA